MKRTKKNPSLIVEFEPEKIIKCYDVNDTKLPKRETSKNLIFQQCIIEYMYETFPKLDPSLYIEGRYVENYDNNNSVKSFLKKGEEVK
jgi:hypothetical protein